MQVLLAVIEDLFQFARTSLLGVLVFEQSGAKTASGLFSGQDTRTIYSYQTAVQEKPASFPFVSPQQAGSPYFIGEPHTRLYVDPVVAFDTAAEVLTYGELVYVLKLGGRWAQVRFGDREGWVLKDVLKERARDVFPAFVSGMKYSAADEETKKLRLCIDDAFGGDKAAEMLSDSEYVTYMLGRKGKQIAWGTARPRIAGTWQQKLRGQAGVYSSITPKTESVMEYVTDTIGHLCFVEAVFPDESIKLSSIGMFAEGVFEEVMMHKDEWKELRPIFIEVL